MGSLSVRDLPVRKAFLVLNHRLGNLHEQPAPSSGFLPFPLPGKLRNPAPGAPGDFPVCKIRKEDP
ncbi:MAG: hypothetical protein C6P37_07625 [Caldibacillus debilis]|uniref:Uncharacterized protein n=1 Tax=Caldibacillus debilis TaxID=301148 RepID=A0A3E0K4W7_9BACI|nr:MAG: hypothetical protein C6P37_07625 [Caldibacillus debilis]